MVYETLNTTGVTKQVLKDLEVKVKLLASKSTSDKKHFRADMNKAAEQELRFLINALSTPDYNKLLSENSVPETFDSTETLINNLFVYVAQIVTAYIPF